MITRRNFLKYSVGASAALALPWLPRRAVAAAGMGGALTKYIQPLPLPGAGIVVARATPIGTNHYAFTQKEIARQLHPDLPPTPLFAYDDGSGLGGQAGSFGMAVVAQSGTPLDVRYTNRLPLTYPDWIPVDTNLTPLGNQVRARSLRRGRQRRQPGSEAEWFRFRSNADRPLHQPAAPDAGHAVVVSRSRFGRDAPERVRRPRRRLYPSRSVRHRLGAQPNRHPRRSVRDSARYPGSSVQPGRDVPVSNERHRRHNLDRGVLRRRDACQRQGLAVPQRRAAPIPVPNPERL